MELEEVKMAQLADFAYPIMTEEVGYPPSPVAAPRAPSGPTPGGAPLGAVVARALQDVLGWKIKPDDPKGFINALNQSFQITMFEGHVESAWTPRSYAVQSDLSGGISGAQASIYTMARTALDQSLPLLDGLYALNPGADEEYVLAFKDMARNQMTELVNELGNLGGPKAPRVNEYFQMLLFGSGRGPRLVVNGIELTIQNPPSSYPDSNSLKGTLGELREQLGLKEGAKPNYVNTVVDEQNVTNFRVLCDYTTGLLQAWQSNFRFFVMTDAGQKFLGTQLVLISRQLSVISEVVDEVRFVMNSVFIGPSERQALLLTFAGDPASQDLTPIFLEDLLCWIQRFATEECPAQIQNGGRFAIKQSIVPMVEKQLAILKATVVFAEGQTSSALKASRVLTSLNKLGTHLKELWRLAKNVGSP
jgi:hypothetical protein